MIRGGLRGVKEWTDTVEFPRIKDLATQTRANHDHENHLPGRICRNNSGRRPASTSRISTKACMIFTMNVGIYLGK